MNESGARAPKYQRIADELRRDIKSGRFGPGERLPAETALLDRFRAVIPGLSLETLRNAVKVLRSEGLIEARQGVGTFVRENRRLQRRSRHRYGRARDDNRLLSDHLRHEIIFAGRGPAPPHIAEPAGMEPGTEMVIRRRVLYDKQTGRAEEVGASYLPVGIAGDTFLEHPAVVPKALFLCVEDLSGQRYGRAQDRWLWRMPTSAEAALLQIAQGAAVVHVVHAASSTDGTLLEVSESVWPADRIELIDDYEITPQGEPLQGLSDI